MLSKPQFYAVSAGLIVAGAGLALLGSMVITALPLSPPVARVVNWLVIAVALSASGGGMSYVAYRRAMGDPTAPPPLPPTDRLHPLMRILAGVLCLPMLATGVMLSVGAARVGEWELLAWGVGCVLISLAFAYVTIVGKDPTVAVVTRLNR